MESFVEHLTEIWTRVLQVAPIEPDSNFFDLGGDSLLAVGMFLEIEALTGRNFPITTIYDAPTIAELAALLDTDDTPQASLLVPLKEGDGGAPVFIVHGIGGTVMELSRLGKLINADNPVYAVQAQGLDGKMAPLASVDEMAAHYIDAIRSKQPHGPYLLCGYSFGGLVAVEMCRRLQQEGEAIGFLVLIDAYAHPRVWPWSTRLRVGWRRFRYRRAELAKQPLHETASYMWQKTKRLIGLRSNGRETQGASRWLRDPGANLPPALRAVRLAGEEALTRHIPLFYHGKIVFVRAAITDPVFPPDPAPLWRPLTREFELHTVPGDHLGIVSEHADHIAAILSRCVADSRGGRGAENVLQNRLTPVTATRQMANVPC